MEQPRIIDLPKIGDKRGNLSLVEEFKQIPLRLNVHTGYTMFQAVRNVVDMHIMRIPNSLWHCQAVLM